MQRQHNFSIDFIRLFAGIGVVIIHTCAPFLNYPPFFNTPTFWLANFLESFFRISVPLFIMISGYLLLSSSEDTLKEFFTKRLSRIGIPLLLWPIFYLLWLQFFSKTSIEIADIPHMFVFMTIKYHLYFLYLILGLYMITPLLRVFNLHASSIEKKYTILLFFVFAVFLMALNQFFIPGVFGFATIFTFFIPYIPYYLAGSFITNITVSKVMYRMLILLYLLLSICTAILNYVYMLSIGWNNTIEANPNLTRYFYDYFSPNIVVMSLIGFLLLIKNTLLENSITIKSKRLITYLSSLTFGVFLLHPMIIELLDLVPFLNLGYIYTPIWMFLLIKIAFVLIISYSSIGLLKTLPIINRLI